MGAAVLHVPGVGSLQYDQQIWLLRLLSIGLLAPLPLLAGYLPPQSRHDFSLANSAEAPVTPASTTPDPLCEAPRYAEFLELPHGLSGYFDLEQAKRCATARNKPIFIDFTGHACVNCR